MCIKKTDLLIRKMIDYVEGRISVDEFYDRTKSDIYLLLINDSKREEWQKEHDYPKYFFKRYDKDKFFDRAELHSIVRIYLMRRNIQFTPRNSDVDFVVFVSSILPSWLDIRDERFLINIIDSAPDGITKTKKKQWCKNRILELFKYEQKPPRWIQSPEWPTGNDGKPMVFRKQSKEHGGSELVRYYFFDPKTNEEKVIDQFY